MTRPAPAFAAVDNKIDRSRSAAAEKERKCLLGVSATATLAAFQGIGDVVQQGERIEALLNAGKDALISLRGADDAHPFLAGMSKDSGYRITTVPRRACARHLANDIFAGGEPATEPVE